VRGLKKNQQTKIIHPSIKSTENNFVFLHSTIKKNQRLFLEEPIIKQGKTLKKWSNNTAFGSPMPGRQFNNGNYRYGFNGKENDNEVKGTGNQQDYGMRIYDPRLGKFLSVDPLFRDFAWNSPYAFAENDVISCIDLDGLEKYKVGKGDFMYFNTDPSRDDSKAVMYPDGTIKDKFDNIDEEKAANALEYFNANGVNKGKGNPVQIQRTTASDVEDKVKITETHKKTDTKEVIKAAAKKAGVPPSVKINFETKKAKIIDDADAKSQLAKLAKFLKNNPSANVVIKGNTIAAPGEITGGGKDALNQKIAPGESKTNGELMLERAGAVKDILVNDYGIKGSRIKTGTGVNNGSKDISTEIK
jgi:RHS repeat-associated protein